MKNLTRSSLLDAPQKGEQGAVDWLGETVVHPLVNAALIEPYLTVSHAVQDLSGKHLSLGEVQPLSLKKTQAYTTDWFIQSAAGGVGSLVPFLIAGKATGMALGGASSYLGLEGKTASILTSNRFAQISGAGIYAAMKRPQEGETRLGNAVGTMGAFAIFDAGNSLASLSTFNKAGALSFSTRSAIRLGSGFLGGLTQAELSSLVAQQKLAANDTVLQSAVAGASLNFALGAVQDIAGGGGAGKTAGKGNESANSSQNKPGDSLPLAQPDALAARSSFLAESRALSEASTTDAVLAGRKSDSQAPSQSSEHGLNIARSENQKAISNLASSKGEGSVVYIVIDSGFSPESLPARKNILGVWDTTGDGVFKDPLQHGSVVLGKLRDADPNAKFMLIRAYDGNNNLSQTKFENGQIARPGWTEAYLEAVALAKEHKLPSVANCSFGEFTHAMDGTGWESFQLAKAIGKDKPGHVVVAAAGPGNGAARHASGVIEAGKAGEVNISQNGEAAFNLWMAKDAPRDWTLSVFEGSRKIHSVDGPSLASNFWNNRQQITFRSHIEGAQTRFVLSRHGSDARPLPFDFFVQEGRASFLDHINPELISEPAAFPDVLAVGIKKLSYSPQQELLGYKPNVLLPGDGPVSFRTPELTLEIGQLLKANPNLDATQIQTILGKFPLGKD